MNIYIRRNEDLFDFLRTESFSDGSMKVAFAENCGLSMQMIVDDIHCRLKVGDFKTLRAYRNSAVRFFTKANSMCEEIMAADDSDRNKCTIPLIPIKRILYPIRLMEMLLPRGLTETSQQVMPRDRILNAGPYTRSPLRCTLSIMPPKTYWRIMDQRVKIVNSSRLENTKALDHAGFMWLFTIRSARWDREFPDCYMSFVPAVIK